MPDSSTINLIDTPSVAPDAPQAAAPAAAISFFGAHELALKNEAPVNHPQATPDWVFPVMVLFVAIFAALKVYYQKFFIQILASFFNATLAKQIVRDENIFVQRATLLLSIVFNLVVAMLLYYTSIALHWKIPGELTGFMRFLFFSLLVASLYASKFLVIRLSAALLGNEREMNAYIFTIFSINNILGILLIPILILMAFTHQLSFIQLLNAALAISAIAYLFRLVRGVLIGLNANTFSGLYLFLYLCALELAPLAVLLKFISKL
ncbi:MAG: hypothetical protein RIQ89_1988 [Bacteroidota bacterium]|jgi:hypothetical protein